ncbi:ribosome-associated translation inhibitor RaiA [soil metagenome]
MEIVVKGRHSEISDRFREHVNEKLLRLDKWDQRQKIQRVEVEVTHERNPRQHDRAARVEMTLLSRGPAVRAEACASDQMSALDAALDKLESRLRRASDRLRVHHGSRTPVSLSTATARGAEVEGSIALAEDEVPVHQVGPLDVIGDGPLVLREKVHKADAMSLDQALYEMELVGHDFYLFVDKESGRPSVVYRRHAYDYGVIGLDVA